MNKNLKFGTIAAAVVLALVSCGGGDSSGGSDKPKPTVNNKPTVFYNRQPSDDNGVMKKVMNHTENTYYAGFDAVAGGDTQARMILDYIEANIETLDRNGDGTIGYVLAIGQNSHNDSMARTKGVRRAFGTLLDESADPDTKQEGKLTIGGKEYKVVELAAQEMRDNAGPWSSTVAADTFAIWLDTYGDQIDLVVSNNDGMAETMVAQMAKVNVEIPTFGYDANQTTLDLILRGGPMKGTISQNHHAQVLATLQLVRNMLDGVTGEDVTKKGFSEKDQYNNMIESAKVNYTKDTKAMLAENGIVTAENAQAVKEDLLDTGIKQTTAPSKKVLWTVYSNTDNFLNQTFIPTVDRYKGFYNLDITYIYGDGTQEASILDNFSGLKAYDAYVINMVETSAGALYQQRLDAEI